MKIIIKDEQANIHCQLQKIWSIKYQIWPMAHSMKGSATTVEDMDMEQSNEAIIVCLKVNGKKTNNTSAEMYKNKYWKSMIKYSNFILMFLKPVDWARKLKIELIFREASIGAFWLRIINFSMCIKKSNYYSYDRLLTYSDHK